jgi:PAS domain S-box-containing protein
MKYLYELALKNKESIMSKVEELCNRDFCVNSGYENVEVIHNIIHPLYNMILEHLINQSCEPDQDIFSLVMGKVADKFNINIIRSFILDGVGIKLLISMLKHFRNGINYSIYQALDNKDTFYKYIEINNKYFDSLELLFYSQWEVIVSSDILLKKVFEHTPFGVFIQAGEHISYINAIGERILGYGIEELSSKSIFDIMHPDYAYAMKQNSKAIDVPNSRVSNTHECKIIAKNGSEVWIDISFSKIEIGGRSCMLGMTVDISDRKKIEELKLQASESKELLNAAMEQDKLRTEFYSNLSHELRTPLNVILGTLQLVDMYSSKNTDPLMDKTKKYYKIMRQNCYRLLRLVNNLVDLNKLDAGYFYLNMENHDIVSIVSQIATSVSDYVENKGISFLYCSKTDTKIIACDPDKIERILLNLLSNAIKFTDSGGRISVNVWNDDSKIYISVKDSGIGIPKEKQDMVFKRFVQIEKSLSRNHHGSGIGLSLAKSLVELHGGKIGLISDTGLGCEFILELPIIQMITMESSSNESKYSSNNKIEVINIEFSDIYS